MKKPSVTVTDLFCGAGGFSTGLRLACEAAGLDLKLIAVNHWDIAIATHSRNHPKSTDFCASLDSVNPRELVPGGKLNLLIASPECTHHSNARGGKPINDQSRTSAFRIVEWASQIRIEHILIENVKEFCFPSETAVLSKRGIVPIGELEIGDDVWTHNARWKPVTAISRRIASTVRVKGYGNSIIEPTPNHEFYARQVAPRITQSGKYGRHESRLLEPEWVRADKLADKDTSSAYADLHSGYTWATPIELPRYWMRMPTTLGVDTGSPAFFYMLGRWLGDGWIIRRKQKQDLVRICSNKTEANDLQSRLNETGLTWHRSSHNESVDVFDLDAAGSRILVRWLQSNFHEYAHRKTLPAWTFGASESQRWALIEGYHDADGHEQSGGEVASTSVSRCLAVGIRLLLQSLGVAASISRQGARMQRSVSDPESQMECREAFQVSWRRSTEWEKCYRTELHLWGRIRAVEPCRENVEVVDITVADDHSFIADGQVVHNCTWGPLGVNGRPLKRRKGEIYQSFLAALRALGYCVEARVLNAADFGDPTARERLFIQAKLGRSPIVWPEKTHAPAIKPSQNGQLFDMSPTRQPYRTAREIIDWSLPGQSIYNRKRPLKQNTLNRIFKGLERFAGIPFIVPQEGDDRIRSIDRPLQVIKTQSRGIGLVQPFIIQMDHSQSDMAGRDIDRPMPTITSADAFGLVNPYIVVLRNNVDVQSLDQPLGTLVAGGNHFGLAQPFIVQMRNGQTAQSVDDPLSVITTTGAHHALCEPYLVKFHGNHEGRKDGQSRNHSVDAPLPTLDCSNRMGLAQPFIIPTNHGKDERSHDINRPMPTITSVDAWALIEPFLVKYNGTGGAMPVSEPLDTVTAKDRFGLVEAEMNGYPVAMLDIRFRMLQPHELAAAMSFPKTYFFAGNREQKVKQIGNAVAVQTAKALCSSILASL
ncbi:MAG: DNA cytosine methyltransferase [Acidobacteriota bacterium]